MGNAFFFDRFCPCRCFVAPISVCSEYFTWYVQQLDPVSVKNTGYCLQFCPLDFLRNQQFFVQLAVDIALTICLSTAVGV